MSNPHTPAALAFIDRPSITHDLPTRHVAGFVSLQTDEPILFKLYAQNDDEYHAASALIVRAVNSHAVLVEALWEIAAFDDAGANEYLAKTGRYGAFDEPGAVETARAALAQLDKP